MASKLRTAEEIQAKIEMLEALRAKWRTLFGDTPTSEFARDQYHQAGCALCVLEWVTGKGASAHLQERSLSNMLAVERLAIKRRLGDGASR